MMRMFINLLFLAGSLLGRATAAQSPDLPVERKTAVENGLVPLETQWSSDPQFRSVAARMDYYNVPGASVALIRRGRIDWAEGYGVRQTGTADSVTADTKFQAASISKPVAAAAMMLLVQEKRLTLDEDINRVLRSWKIPSDGYTGEAPVTLRRLLSHTAGLNVHGFPGYAPGEPLPETAGILNGEGNTVPVRVIERPGAAWRYSGGGYLVVQLLAEETYGYGFESFLQETILEPLGMSNSTFAQPLPDSVVTDVATAHRFDGVPVRGSWHIYPELAAAGLWTTATDLARFAIGLRSAWAGEPDAVLEREPAREMLTEQMGGFGLGPMVHGSGLRLRFSHSGTNEGFHAFFLIHAVSGDGIVVLTNSENGIYLIEEIVRSAAYVYGWNN